MYCQNCKATLPESAKFCTMCGAKINVSFCPNGHVMEPAETSCRYCPPAAAKGTGAASASLSAATTIDSITNRPDAPPLSFGLTTVETLEERPAAGVSRFGTTMIIQEREEEPTALLGWLVVVDGEQKWRDFKITKKKTTIGRSHECDLVLEQNQVSGKHASLRLLDDGLYLTDLDSSNGTFVNGEEVVNQRLLDNELIRIGEVTLKFKAF